MSNCNEIIKRLENLAKHAVHYVGEPPFVMSLDDGIALHNAINLLKAQEPMVLTLDEVLNSEDFVWAEIWTPGDRRWCLIYARINKSIYDDILMLHEDSGFRWTRLESNYNMKGGWRCWSARPTEDQRKNTPWEGEKE